MVQRQTVFGGDRRGAPRQLAAAPWYAGRMLVPGVSQRRGLLVGMRRGFRYGLDPQGRKLVADPGETTGDLVREMVDVLTGFCRRLHGRRGARNRAVRAVPCSKQPPGAGAGLAGDVQDD
jgi:hypothetical protein